MNLHKITIISLTALWVFTVCANTRNTTALNGQILKNRITTSSLDSRASHDEQDLNLRITVTDESVLDNLAAEGFRFTSRFGTLAYIKITPEQIEYIASKEGVILLDAPHSAEVSCDISRSAMNADELLRGIPVGDDIIPYTGKGVIIGVVDTGVQPTHIAFMDSKDRASTRVRQYVYIDEDDNEELIVSKYNTPEEIASAPTNYYSDGHGTHVGGIASGAWMGNSYSGVAPDAELVLVSMTTLRDEAVLSGIDATRLYAEQVEKPLVVNLSLGSINGAHDGNNYVTDYMKNFGTTGFLVNFSAGNDGNDVATLEKDFSADNSPLRTYFCAHNPDLLPEIAYGEIWSDDEKTFDLKVFVIDVPSKKVVYTSPALNLPTRVNDLNEGLILLSPIAEYPSELTTLENYFNGLCYVVGGFDPMSNRFCTTIAAQFSEFGEGFNYLLGIEITSADGATILLTSPATQCVLAGRYGNCVYGNAKNSISDLSTSPYVLSIGSWNARNKYLNQQGVETDCNLSYFGNFNDIANYSSYGRGFGAAKGLTWPHVAAPGTYVIAPYHSDYVAEDQSTLAYTQNVDGTDYHWGFYSGTSMATPNATGVMALWLEARPDLTRDQVLDVIKNSSINDDFTAASPQKFGAGKLDAYAGLKYIQTNLGISTLVEQPSLPLKLMVRQFGGGAMECVLPPIVKNGCLRIITTDGSIQYAKSFQGNVINLDTPLHKGIYLLNVSTGAGSVTQKIVIR